MTKPKWYTLAGMLVVVTLGTLFVRFPVGIGYFNFGDVAVVFAALALGRTGGLLAGGLGSALADVAGGYALFAPLTFLAKGIEGWIIGNARGRSGHLHYLFLLLGSMSMVLIYFLGEYRIDALGGPASALAELLPNLVQAVLGMVGGRLLFLAWDRSQAKRSD